MTKEELSEEIRTLGNIALPVDLGAAKVLYTLAGDLNLYGTGPIADWCDNHARECLQRIMQARGSS